MHNLVANSDQAIGNHLGTAASVLMTHLPSAVGIWSPSQGSSCIWEAQPSYNSLSNGGGEGIRASWIRNVTGPCRRASGSSLHFATHGITTRRPLDTPVLLVVDSCAVLDVVEFEEGVAHGDDGGWS